MSGEGWRIGYSPDAEIFVGLIGAENWAIELTEDEFTDFYRLGCQLIETMAAMQLELSDEEKLTCSAQTANISIDRIGSDLIPAVNHELRKLEALDLASIYLDIPLEQEAAANAYCELESIGFFWGSWMPNFSTKGDSLRLQKIYQAVDVETILCARTQGNDIKNYVISEWQRVSQKIV